MDDVDAVFETILDWSAFSIRIAEVRAWVAILPYRSVSASTCMVLHWHSDSSQILWQQMSVPKPGLSYHVKCWIFLSPMDHRTCSMIVFPDTSPVWFFSGNLECSSESICWLSLTGWCKKDSRYPESDSRLSDWGNAGGPQPCLAQICLL